MTDKWSVSDSSGKRLSGAKPALPNATRAGKGLAKDDLLGGHGRRVSGGWGQVGGGHGACPGDMSKPLARPRSGPEGMPKAAGAPPSHPRRGAALETCSGRS